MGPGGFGRGVRVDAARHGSRPGRWFGEVSRAPVNSIRILVPCRHHGQWVFDDPDTGLVREPFVAGIDTMTDGVVADIPGAADGFRLLFPAAPFPGHTVERTWRREETGGHWYWSEEHGWDVCGGGCSRARCGS